MTSFVQWRCSFHHQPVCRLYFKPFAFHSSQTLRAQEKCIARAKPLRVLSAAELIDFYGDGDPNDRSSDQAASVPVSAIWQGASFLAHKKNYACCGNISEEVRLKWAPRLGRTARNSEPMHSQLERGSLHSKMCCRPVGTCHNPIALFKSFENLLTFRFL
jgi:hypothetical protein